MNKNKINSGYTQRWVVYRGRCFNLLSYRKIGKMIELYKITVLRNYISGSILPVKRLSGDSQVDLKKTFSSSLAYRRQYAISMGLLLLLHNVSVEVSQWRYR